jgi:hypothetical protein
MIADDVLVSARVRMADDGRIRAYPQRSRCRITLICLIGEPSRNARGVKPFPRQAFSRESKMRKLIIMTLLFTLAGLSANQRGAAACTAMVPVA